MLRGRAALVTGASRGLGRAIAARLVADGADVLLLARDMDALEEAGAAILDAQPDPRPRVHLQAGDVSHPADVEAAVTEAVERFGRLDVLVCNAGIYGPIGPVDDVDWVGWQRAIEVNLLGTVLCCRAALPIMRRQRRGKIVVVSGGGATQAQPMFSAYAASKAGVVRFAETIAAELVGSGIDVNAISPGPLDTRMLDEVLAAGPEQAGAEAHARAVAWKAGVGCAPLSGAADLAAFLASDASDGITGRLISAVWDDWRGLPGRHLAPEDYTLRRVVPS